MAAAPAHALTTQYLTTRNYHLFLYHGLDSTMEFPKQQLFTMSDQCNEITIIPEGRTKQRSVQGTTFEKVTKDFASSVSVDASYAGMFSASVKTDFQQRGANSRSTAMSKQTWEWNVARVFLKSKVLTAGAERALNTNNSRGWEKELIQDYGVLYAKGVVTGATVATYYSTESNKADSAASMMACVDMSGSFAGASASASTTVSSKTTSQMQGDQITLSMASIGGDSTTWDWTQGWKDPMTNQPTWIQSAKRNPHIIHMDVHPIWDLIRDEGRKEAVKKEVLKLQEDAIKDGDEVYIKSLTGQYITDVTPGGYALLSKNACYGKARFKVAFGSIACSSSVFNNGIRFQHVGAGFNYSKRYNYMYASTGGYRYGCFGSYEDNTKQLFVAQDPHNRAVLKHKQGELKYKKPIVLADAFVSSVMCCSECYYDDKFDYLCFQYENATAYFDKDNEKHCMEWILEKAEPRGQKRSASSI